jgi:hypothetical protein
MRRAGQIAVRNADLSTLAHDNAACGRERSMDQSQGSPCDRTLGEAAVTRCPAPIEVEIDRAVWMSANFQVPLHSHPPLFQESDCI